jgi:glycosyltransferase involved in cell wall biosynthesis
MGESLVSVVTPVYNGEDYLRECFDSVLAQTHRNFEYVIVNNCSKDRTLEIAREYARKDPRIRVHDNEKFVGVIANHNIAFGLISREAKYCKVVSADDFIFPDCLRQLVAVGEANPSAGFIGCYQLSGKRILWQGFVYPQASFDGRELCKKVFLEGDPAFGFGTPTSLLYRADLVRSSETFYPNASPHADTSACFKYLEKSDFGFAYQVLSFERTHPLTQSSKSAILNRYSSAYIDDLIQYGRFYLSEEQWKRRLQEELNAYYQFLAMSAIRRRDAEFWDYHRERLKELGHPISTLKLLRGGLSKLTGALVNPAQTVRKLRRRSQA